MKSLLSLLFVFSLVHFSAQTEAIEPNLSTPIYLFAQCMYEIDDKDAFMEMENQFRLNPTVKVVRFDWSTKRVFVLMHNITSLSESEFRAWFSTNSNLPTCVQIGVHGTDTVKPYPFTNCNN
jgi:hypothetical protein